MSSRGTPIRKPLTPSLNLATLSVGASGKLLRISRIVTGNGVQHDGQVLDRARDRPDMIGGIRLRDDAGRTDQSKGRLDAGDTAKCRRKPD